MNRHTLVDRVFLGLARAASWRNGQYFRDGFSSASFAEHLAAVELALPALDAAQTALELVARTRAGALDCGLLVLRRDPGETTPLLVWHHGGGEIPFDRTIRRALAAGEALPQQPSYDGLTCELWETGHITGAGASAAIRGALARQLSPSPPAAATSGRAAR